MWRWSWWASKHSWLNLDLFCTGWRLSSRTWASASVGAISQVLLPLHSTQLSTSRESTPYHMPMRNQVSFFCYTEVPFGFCFLVVVVVVIVLCVCVCVCVCRSEDNLQMSVFSLHHVRPRDWTHVNRFDSKCSYPQAISPAPICLDCLFSYFINTKAGT